MELKKYRELFFLILAIWFVIVGGFLFIDIFIVPIDLSIPGGLGDLINEFFQISITTVLKDPPGPATAGISGYLSDE